MSTTTLRYRALTLDFLPHRRERQIGSAVRRLKTRVSRRNFKKITRSLLPQLNT